MRAQRCELHKENPICLMTSHSSRDMLVTHTKGGPQDNSFFATYISGLTIVIELEAFVVKSRH